MPVRPNSLSQTPVELDLEDPRGDVLADVLGVALLRNAVYKRLEAGAPWGLAMPFRKRAVFYVIARGSALLEVEGEPRKQLTAGEVAFIPHGTAHVIRDALTTKPVPTCDGRPSPFNGSLNGQHDASICAAGAIRKIGGDGPVTTIITGFFGLTAGRVPALLENMPRVEIISPSSAASSRWIAPTVQLLLAESAAPGPASAMVLQRLADVLFVQALRCLSHQEPCKSGLSRTNGLTALSDPAIHQALTSMHTRVGAPWTVAALAAQAGLSRSGFAARFTELVGEPPLQYLARWRIARAAELLRNTSDAISEVAGRVGYESVPSFSKAFKKWQGVSPGAFRSRGGHVQPIDPTLPSSTASGM